MSDPVNPGVFSTFFSKSQFETLEEKLDVKHKQNNLFIGIPKEVRFMENRVALVPNSIRVLTGYGHRVRVESDAGKNCNFTDQNFSDAGAEIVQDKQRVFESHILIKVQPPTLEEIDLLHPNQILISPLSLPIITDEYVKKLKDKGVIAIAMEYLQASDGSFPIVRMMSEIAGLSAVLTASELMTNGQGGRGVLMGGISGVPPSKVVILGAGVVGEYATRTAIGLGASVRIFDNDIYKLMRIQNQVGRKLHTSTLNPVYLAYQLLSADVVIGAVHSQEGRTPIIVTEEMVMKMKDGSVIIDVSIDQGGCFETSEVTTLKNPTFIKHGVTHFCVPNIASKVSRTASLAISNILVPLMIKVGHARSLENFLFRNQGMRNGVYMYKGKLTNEYLSRRFNMIFTDLNLLLTSET